MVKYKYNHFIGGFYIFNSNDKDILLYGFNEYCVEKQSYNVSTTSTYVGILEIFFEKVIINKIKKNDYYSLFNLGNLRTMRSLVKNNALRAVFLSFLDFLHNEEFIEDKSTYLELKDRISNTIEGTNKNIRPNKDYLSPKALQKIFSRSLAYQTNEEKILTPLISALSFFCLYKQGDIFRLKISDVNLQTRTIRNLRYNDTNNLAEHINMNDTFYILMQDYLNYRKQLNLDIEALLIVENKPIDMTGINQFLGVYKRTENKSQLHIDSIGCEAFIKSMIYYLLMYQGEDGLISIFRMLEKENQYFKYAFNDYIENKRSNLSTEPLRKYELDDLLPQNKSLELQILKEDSKNTNSINLIPSSNDIFNLLEPYSIEKDLKFEDLEAFELNSNQNHSETKIHIQRLVRNSNISQKLKEHYEFRCQVCSYRIPKADGSFSAEAHHIQPYNRIHQGDDTTQNLLILCPNCHTQFDDMYFAIEPDTLLIHSIFENDDYHLSELILKHNLGKDYLNYTWALFQKKKQGYPFNLTTQN